MDTRMKPGLQHKKLIIFLSLLTLPFTTTVGQDWKTLLDLRGTWRIELGDNMEWADPKFNDSKWDDIKVPAAWENEGFPGYDGYAWYRKHFTINPDLKNDHVYLHVGYVDDVSEVYLNGHFIGFQGMFPPNFTTAYNTYGQYAVPQQYLNYKGDNVVAVRVYDMMMAGGITNGRIGLFEARDYLKPDYAITGTWKFRTGDDESWKDANIDDSKWKDVVVPAYWETQGFKEYDGIGWYRLKFTTPQQFTEKRLILLVGKIDDIDETYLNGELVGKTGRIRAGMTLADVGDSYTQLRAYTISSDILLPGQENVLAVRVDDVYMHGGIYDGPIGFVTRDKYLRWKKERDEWWNLFHWFDN